MPTVRRPARWVFLYFALATFDLVMVGGSLYLNHRIMNLYASSGAENVLWAGRLDAYAELGRWSAATNAPGNDVFDSRDVVAERRRLELARDRFDELWRRARSELDNERDREAARALEQDLDRVHAAMNQMTEEAARIFVYFEAGHPERAGERMATMDRKYAALTGALADLNGRIRSIQSARFESQMARAEALRQLEWILSTLVLVMIAGALHFGRRIRAQMEATEREREIHQAGIEEAKVAAEAANEAKTRFLATMSHEIRTPLNGVLGMTDLLLATRLEGEQREFAETISQSGNHLLDVINDILDFSKIEADRLVLEAAPVDLVDLIEEVATVCAERAHRKHLELVYEVDPEIPTHLLADRVRVRQVLLNLTSNAVKFTERGEVALRAERLPNPVEAAAVRVRFSVCDTGIGVRPEDQARIFSPFTQADETTTRRFGGSGLGLAISRELVARMGGLLTLESVVDVGSRFSFELDLPVAAPIPSATAEPVDLQLGGLRVLVVDDNATNRTILERHLASWGAEAHVCAGAGEALETLRRASEHGSRFDLGIFDLAMPHMDGIDLVQAIEADSALASLPVVLLTSMDVARERLAERPASVVAQLCKPTRKAQLFASLVAASGRSAGPRAAESGTSVALDRPSFDLEVLLVEDNLVNQRVCAALLARLGCRAEVVGTGVGALAAFDGKDLILMDCELPDLDGVEVTRRVRALERAAGLGGRVPILALTAHATEPQRRACLAAGMDGFLTKPVSLTDLAAAIEGLVPKTPRPIAENASRRVRLDSKSSA